VTADGFQIATEAAERYERHVSMFMLPFADAIVDAIFDAIVDAIERAPSDVRPFHSVLDVACGTGFVTRRLVGRAARVVGADVNPAMVRAAEKLCPPGIEWVIAPAESMPFTAGEFAAVVCQQGAQFFPDMAAGFQEMRRVLRPGGRLAATVWAPMDRNAFMEAQALAMRAVCGDAQTASFWKAIPPNGHELLATAARTAGFADVEVREVSSVAELPPITEYLPNQLSATPWGPLFAALDTDAKQRVIDVARTHLRAYEDAEARLRVPFVSHLLLAS
jgi:ubiquinone/menaquinone biosynthesis C-methylase UbiE